MSTIFELTANQSALQKAVEDGELTPEQAADTFDSMGDELNDKINDYCRVRQCMLSDVAAIDAEIERLNKLKATKKNSISRLQETLRLGLSCIELTKFDTGLFNGYFRAGSKSVQITNVENIPAEYVETNLIEKPDKKAIKSAIESGVSVPGAELVTGKASLIIK